MSFHGVVRLFHQIVIYIISTTVRSGLPDGLVFWVCHDSVRSVYPTVYELPRCREVGFIQRLYIIFTAVRSGLPNGLGWVHGMVHCWFLCK